MRDTFSFVLTLLGVFLSINVCASSISIIDDEGIEHTFDQPLQRIVSLMPHATELLFEVGAGDHVVGAVQYSDYPEAAKKIPRVGGYSALNIEAIVALKPDLFERCICVFS